MRTKEAFLPRHLIREGVTRLGKDPSSRRTCETLLSELLEVNRTTLYLEEGNLSEEISQRFFSLIEGLKNREPLQYLLEKAPFMGEYFKVTPSCFIPRPETEGLVEASLDYFKNSRPRSLLFIDIGTGCGCIAISLTKRILCSKMLAIDLREETVKVAQENGRLHRVSEKIHWLCGDLLAPLRKGWVEADAILSNPPYIPSEAMALLPPEVLREPRISLDGGESGLLYYRRIALEAASFLKEGGFLFLEIGDGQADAVRELFLEKTPLHFCEVRKDVQGIARVLIFQKGNRG